ncbi:MAG TPA: cbb3-type cytochrome c oxidase subunit I, partial [Gemmatimonadaceae bacterium]
MATTIAAPAFAGTKRKYESGLWSWLATTDHKRIGQLYLYTALAWFLVGGIEALIIRTQLYGPNGRVVSAETYNQLFTMHGLSMIFLAIMPLSAAFFNFLIPLQIGARDVAFPRLNAFSYWVYLFGSLVLNASWLFGAAPNGGWFGYAPLSTPQFSPGLNMDFYVVGLQILGISTLAAGFNFITTIINMRAPGMHFMRMPVFTWAAFVTQFLIVLSFPIITVAVTFLLFDRFFGTNFYEISAGADPLLWQHLFWLFGHPEVYILILPAFGLVSEVLPPFSRKPLFGYPVMVYSLILIGFLGFGVWAHHMFAVGMGPVADSIFGITTMLIAIPTGVKIFNWLGTMWGGSIRFTTACLFAIGLVGLFTIGGISGVMHSSPPSDLQQTDSYFIVAHFHYVLNGAVVFPIFAAVYHWFPKMIGRELSARLGRWSFWIMVISFQFTFFPMHVLGLLGMPRR